MRLFVACLFSIIVSACATTTPAPITESLVFVSQRSGEGDIYAIDLDQLAVMPLITTAAPEGNPVWDRARARLVHQRFGENGADLYSDQQRIMRDPNGDTPPSWSPDGDNIVFAANRDGNANLYLARVDGSGERRLTDGRFTDRYPVFSPDGTRIVFARKDDIGWDLHTYDMQTAKTTRHTLDGVYVGHPAWSPDGLQVVFDRHWGEQADIATLELATGTIRRLTNRDGDDLKPTFSLDGQRIAFSARQDNQWDVWELDTRNLGLRQLTNSPSFDGAPLYVPREIWVHLIRPNSAVLE